jgi:polar amino acid transport system substrate-binding protein
MRRAISFIAILLVAQYTYARDTVEVLTYNWEPYINSENQPVGTAAEMLNVVAAYADMDVKWKYLPYADAQSLLELKQFTLSFPYYYSVERAEKFHYSKPLYHAVINIFYNRRFNADINSAEEVATKSMGKVIGYSYGEKFDDLVKDAKTYESEIGALRALLNHEIDLLPMTEGVMTQLMNSYFPAQVKLIAPVQLDQYQSNFNMYVIAAKTDLGLQMIDRINTAIELKTKQQGDFIQPAPENVEPIDTVVLNMSEGYPAIIGRTIDNEQRSCALESTNSQYFTLPLGTQAIVISWSGTIQHPSNTDRLYKNMMEESYVLILNGPHIGKEFCVKNMHINLK